VVGMREDFGGRRIVNIKLNLAQKKANVNIMKVDENFTAADVTSFNNVIKSLIAKAWGVPASDIQEDIF